jgi:hypothetical protein
LLDHAVAGKETGLTQLTPLAVHGHDYFGVLRQQRCHSPSFPG